MAPVHTTATHVTGLTGVEEGESVTVESTDEALLINGDPLPREVITNLEIATSAETTPEQAAGDVFGSFAPDVSRVVLSTEEGPAVFDLEDPTRPSRSRTGSRPRLFLAYNTERPADDGPICRR